FSQDAILCYIKFQHVRPEFCRQFINVYGRSIGESCFAYVQGILQLCRQADRTMSELDKVRYILRGVAKSVFWVLALMKVSTVSALLEVQEFDLLLADRLESSFFGRLDDVINIPSFRALSSEESLESCASDDSGLSKFSRRRRKRHHKPVNCPSSSLRETVTEIVKEVIALQQLSPALPLRSASPSIWPAKRSLPSQIGHSSFLRQKCCWTCGSPHHLHRCFLYQYHSPVHLNPSGGF